MMTESRRSTFRRVKLSTEPRMAGAEIDLAVVQPLNLELITTFDRSRVLNTFPNRASLVPIP